MLVATQLTPDPAGHGTHTQLGLAPCGFLLMTGLPCPGCGLTTCFAHMVRMEIVDALRASPFGVSLFLVSLAAVPLGFHGMARGTPVLATLDRLRVELVAMGLSAFALVAWVVRVWIAS
jgi:hypothetical protein